MRRRVLLVVGVGVGVGRRSGSIGSGRDILDRVVFEDGNWERDSGFTTDFERAAGVCDVGLVFGAEVEGRFMLVVSRRVEVTC
jgi:hypothetical protein